MNKYLRSGQAGIMLTLIVLVLTTITTAAVAVAISTTRDTTTLSLGEEALSIAETGAENAILHLLRDPNYTGEINLPIGDGSATITVSGSGNQTIVSTGASGVVLRTVQVDITTTNGQVSVINWIEQ